MSSKLIFFKLLIKSNPKKDDKIKRGADGRANALDKFCYIKLIELILIFAKNILQFTQN